MFSKLGSIQFLENYAERISGGVLFGYIYRFANPNTDIFLRSFAKIYVFDHSNFLLFVNEWFRGFPERRIKMNR